MSYFRKMQLLRQIEDHASALWTENAPILLAVRELRRLLDGLEPTTTQEVLAERLQELRSIFGNNTTTVERLEWMRLGAAWAERLENLAPRSDYGCVCGFRGTMDQVFDHVRDSLATGEAHAIDLRSS